MNKYLLMLGFSLLLSCSENTAGGFGSETGNRVSGAVTLNNQPAYGARVVAREMISADSLETQADSDGKYEFKLPEGKWQIEASHLSSGEADEENSDDANSIKLGAVTFVRSVDYDSDENDLNLEPMVQLEGKADPAKGAQVKVLGMNRKASLDAQGKWVVPGIPRGGYVARLLSDDEAIVLSEAPVSTEAENIDVFHGIDTLVIDDFEDDSPANLLAPLFGGGWWNSWDKPETGGYYVPDTLSKNFTQALKTTNSYEGQQYLQVEFYPEAEQNLGIYLQIGGVWSAEHVDHAWHSLQDVQSINMAMAGTGSVRLKLWVRTPPPERGEFFLIKEVTLNTEWTAYQWSLEEFTAEYDKGYAFDDLEIKGLEWDVDSATTLQLDHIWLEGLTLTEFY